MFEKFGEYKDKDKYTMSYDPKLKSEETKRLLEFICDLIIDGYSTCSISSNLCKELGFKTINAKALVSKGYKDYMAFIRKGSDDLREKNISRLNKIYRDAMADGDKRTAIDAVDKLNKMISAYENKVKISSDNFELKFGDD